LEDSDEQLMNLYLSKSSVTAFRTLFERYEKPLFKYLNGKASRLGTSVIEDLFQKTWLKVHEKRQSYDSTYKFSSWLYTIALNNLRDYIDLSSVKLEVDVDDFSQYSLPAVDAEAQLEAKLDIERVNLAAQDLSTVQREVLTLVEIEGLPISEAAAKLSISQDAVRQHLSRAKKKLRAAINEGEPT